MAISVQVPKDLSGIKTKVALNLTKRQIICFSGAAVTGIPLYFLTKGLIGTSAASLLMMGAMLPFFFFAMYEKNGFRGEDFVFYAPAEDTHTGHKTIPDRELIQAVGRERKNTKGGSLS